MTTESAPARAGTGFGPGALATPANAVTIARILVTPILITVILAGGASWPAVAFWVVLSGTDWVDGYLARRQGITRSGAFLDPLADKCLILGAMSALVVDGVFWWPPVTLIAVREVAVSLYRTWMGKRGISIPARWWAKVKTVVQQVAVALVLLPATSGHPSAAVTALWAAAALTLFTGCQYLLDAQRVVAAAEAAGHGSRAV
ncbi:MAG TPA: CDP-diacylglycerol--glycerol-3-phosphate 3-phosphatidyltransferase [Acidimicrobiales bacterium]|nr:CDP-diacylglycerol--glycerol-3-phosphate 3-phosphatidyltransferase [Acidimicrobiales bacterium]